MIRLALDSDDPAALTGIVPFLFTYSDITSDAELAELRARFPASQVLLIDRGLGDPGRRATLADVETGALTPASLPGWLDERRGTPFLTAYCNRNTLPAVVQAVGSRPCWHWVATLDGTCHIDGYPALGGPALVQILGEQQLGIHADLSIVLHDGWHPARYLVSPAVAAELANLRKGYVDLGTTVTGLLRDLASV